jgi:uncharacterized protein involved in outer membrane biogenesis
MLAVLRRIFLGLPGVIASGLVLAYLLFAWFAFEPLAKWITPKIVADKSQHVLTMERARFDPLRLTLHVEGLKLSEPGGKPLFAFADLLVDFQVASLFRRAYTFREVRLSAPDAQLEIRRDGSLNWAALIDAFAGHDQTKPAPDAAPTRVLIEHAALRGGRLTFEDNRAGAAFKTVAEPLDLELRDVSTLPDDTGTHAVSARTSIGAQVRWKGVIGLNPLVASGDVVIEDLQLARIWPLLRSPLQMAAPEGQLALSFSYHASRQHEQLSLQVDKLNAALQALALRGSDERDPALVVDKMSFSGGRVDLIGRTASLDAIEIDGGRVALARAPDGQLNVQRWAAAAPVPPAQAAQSSTPAAASDAKPWRFAVGRVAVERVACRLVDHGFAAPLSAEVSAVKAAFKADAVVDSARALELKVDDLGVEVTGVRLHSESIKAPLLELERVLLQGGRLDLAARQASLAKLALSGGRATVTRDAHGNVSSLDALRASRSSEPARDATPRTAATPEAAHAATPPKPDATRDASAWRYRIDKVEADALHLALREEAVAPPLALTLQNIHAEAQGVSDDAKAAVPVQLRFQVQEGGRFEAQGNVMPAAQSADLRLKLTGLALKPVQPYVAHATNLALVGGQAATSGRVRYEGGKVRYDGEFVVRDLLLNEAGTDQRFLAWKSLGSSRLVVTQERLDIDELRVDGLGAKLLISKDRTINVAKVLKANEPAAATAPKPAAAAASAPAGGARDFQVKVARVRVTDGDVDFADLSLALPFAARIHGLQGQLVGLSNQPGSAAQLEFQGQVDEYGLARAAGQINLFDPTAFTDVKVLFQNVEMTRLTPYSATFAGRKIDSGKLSLDLEYKVKARQLQGDNKVVMDRLTLGERVESPGAANLPLDLAIAILQDENGKIDLGLPVSGSLDDPQFSLGSIVWKAVTNVITRVVTAPFRALGALFGAAGEQMAKLVFDAGGAELLPPEREKLKSLAQALAKRPQLSLTVHSAYNPRADRAVLQEARLRRAIAAQMGREPAAGEDIGPVSTADANVRTAIEQLYVARFGAGAAQDLKAKHAQANPAPPPTDAAGRLASRLSNLFKSEPPPLAAEEAAQLKGADLYARMLERLREAEPVGDEQLIALATGRAQSISRELMADGVAADRIHVDAPTKADANEREVAVTISLGAMPKGDRPAQGPTATAALSGRAAAALTH